MIGIRAIPASWAKMKAHLTRAINKDGTLKKFPCRSLLVVINPSSMDMDYLLLSVSNEIIDERKDSK